MTRRIESERQFKSMIVLTTLLAVVLILALFPCGRYLSETVTASAQQAVGLRNSHEAIEESWRRCRQLQIDETRPRVERFFAQAPPEYQKLLRYAGMGPGEGLLRWANYDWTILLSSKVFEADDQGRSYRFRPRTRSVWLMNVDMPESEGGKATELYNDEIQDDHFSAKGGNGLGAVGGRTRHQTSRLCPVRARISVRRHGWGKFGPGRGRHGWNWP